MRCKAELGGLGSEIPRHPALQVNLLGAYQLFLNGKPIGNSGNIASGNYSQNYIETFPVAASELTRGPVFESNSSPHYSTARPGG